MVLEDLGTFLQDAGLGTLGTTLFLGGLPLDAPNVTTQDTIAALVETPGFPPMYVHDAPTISWEQPVVQLLTRGAPYDYGGVRQWAQDLFLALGRIRNTHLSGTYYFWVSPVQSVFKLRDDDYARPILTCQFRCGKAVDMEPAVQKYVYTFTNATVISIPGSLHGLGTADLTLTVWDNGTPRRTVEVSGEVDPLTFTVTIPLLQPLSGRVVLFG